MPIPRGSTPLSTLCSRESRIRRSSQALWDPTNTWRRERSSCKVWCGRGPCRRVLTGYRHARAKRVEATNHETKDTAPPSRNHTASWPAFGGTGIPACANEGTGQECLCHPMHCCPPLNGEIALLFHDPVGPNGKRADTSEFDRNCVKAIARLRQCPQVAQMFDNRDS